MVPAEGRHAESDDKFKEKCSYTELDLSRLVTWLASLYGMHAEFHCGLGLFS